MYIESCMRYVHIERFFFFFFFFFDMKEKKLSMYMNSDIRMCVCEKKFINKMKVLISLLGKCLGMYMKKEI